MRAYATSRHVIAFGEDVVPVQSPSGGYVRGEVVPVFSAAMYVQRMAIRRP